MTSKSKTQKPKKIRPSGVTVRMTKGGGFTMKAYGPNAPDLRTVIPGLLGGKPTKELGGKPTKEPPEPSKPPEPSEPPKPSGAASGSATPETKPRLLSHRITVGLGGKGFRAICSCGWHSDANMIQAAVIAEGRRHQEQENSSQEKSS